MAYKVYDHLGGSSYFAGLDSAIEYAAKVYKTLPTPSRYGRVYIIEERYCGAVWISDDGDDGDIIYEEVD